MGSILRVNNKKRAGFIGGGLAILLFVIDKVSGGILSKIGSDTILPLCITALNNIVRDKYSIVLLIVVAIFLVAISVMIWVYRGLQNKMDNIKENIDDAQKKMEDVGNRVSNTSVAQIYVGRNNEFADDVLNTLRGGVREVKLMGISLHNFVRSNVMRDVWEEIIKMKRECEIDAKVLIIDPECYGAKLFSAGEARRSDSPLPIDVKAVIGKLKENNFTFKFYQLPPTLFVLWTDSVSYVQPYYFWSKQSSEHDMPLFKFMNNSRLHEGLKDHFDWIWEHASVSPKDYSEKHLYRIDEGIYSNNVINATSDSQDFYNRISMLIKETEQRLYIQGVTLFPLFDKEVTSKAIRERIENSNRTEIKFLLLNPFSMQAKYRSYRQHRDEHPNLQISFEEFEQKFLKVSTIYRNIKDATEKLQEIKKNHDNVDFKWYSGVPYCVLILGDKSVLTEQYYYSKLGHLTEAVHDESKILCLEHAREASALFKLNNRDASIQEKSIYNMMQEHFNFVYHYCATQVDSDKLNNL